jgi:hypothetical protein
VATGAQPDRTFVKPCDDFEDDYIKAPKDSGYRALSLLVGVPVAVGDRTEPITCEIQIRTLLQHAWGELTHEDTYKPEMKTPELIVILSKRLANTLAVLDEIAQDIRNELDKLEVDQAAPLTMPEPTAITQSVSSVPPIEPTVEVQEPPGAAELPTPQAEQVPHPPKPLVTLDVLKAAFRAVFDRNAQLDEQQVTMLIERLNDFGHSEPSDIEQALREMLERLAPIEAKYESVVGLNDFGRLWHSAKFIHDPEKGAAYIEETFKNFARKKEEAAEFVASFPVGREVLGTIVHVASDYALVQLPEGVTGIVHVTAIKKRPNDYLDVHEVVSEGETVRVRIVSSDAASKRIGLSLVRQ